jgi:hypothetical protein
VAVLARRRDLLALSRIESRFLSYPARSLVAVPTELSLLLTFVVGCEVSGFRSVDGEDSDHLGCCFV